MIPFFENRRPIPVRWPKVTGKTILRRLPAVLMAALVLCMLLGHESAASAASAQSKFYAAERCYSDLRGSAKRQKYRDQWLRCIDRFMSVYRHDPKGEWAAAGLFKAGELYSELYKRSYKKEDKQEALDLFNQLIKDYQSSRYSQKARDALKAYTDEQPGSTVQTVSDGEARKWYKTARQRYHRLQKNPSHKKYRDKWMACINAYRKAYQEDMDGPLAAASLYGIANCYEGLHHFSGMEVDRIQSRKTYQELLARFPSSPYARKVEPVADDSRHDGGDKNGGDPIAGVIKQTAASPAQDNTEAVANVSTQTPSVIEGLRFWSNPRYTRVVIDANQDTVFTYHELREDPDIGKPQRIYIDVHNSRLSRNLQKVVPINDNLLSDARAGQYAPDTVRVVIDIKSFKTYKIFSLKNPFRIVLDVWGIQPVDVAKSDPKPAPSKGGGGDKLTTTSAIVKQLALGVKRIVIDPGHGGKDYGAPGYLKGVHEKNIVLQIGKRLAKMISSELNCDVVMTRNTDTYLSLEERTAIANTQDADLFISIHTNASPDHRAYGTETFILNLATDDEAIRVAARENATSKKNISDLDSILHDLMQNAKVSESSRLASYVQQAMLQRLRKKYNRIRSKGVKQAPFYVLLGAEMPSILVETAFISNPRECKRLTTSAYQTELCRGIIEGVKQYIEETKPVAYKNAGTQTRKSGS